MGGAIRNNRLGIARAIILTTTMLTAFGAAPALAELAGDEQEPVITVFGHRHAYSEEETSTATRTDTPLRDVPQSVSVITNDLIEDQGMRSMADVVRYVPGVSMGQGEGHRDAPTLRGNSSTADFYVDGVRDDVQYYRDLYNAERIEVLKGSNAMIFGRGGGGGVINRVTEWVESKQIGKATRVWAFAHVLPGAVVGNDGNICDHVFIENDVVVGNRVTVKGGVQLWAGIRLEDDVFVWTERHVYE